MITDIDFLLGIRIDLQRLNLLSLRNRMALPCVPRTPGNAIKTPSKGRSVGGLWLQVGIFDSLSFQETRDAGVAS